MRSRTAIWFECRIAYEKTMDDGLQKKVKENYVVDALSFTEAESRIMEEMSSYISGEFTIEDIKIASYKEIFFSDDEMADRWYKAKLQFITIDEKTEKEKRSNVNYLVQAGSLKGAVGNIESVMGTTMIDYVIASVAETTLMDVLSMASSLPRTTNPSLKANVVMSLRSMTFVTTRQNSNKFVFALAVPKVQRPFINSTIKS